MSNETGYVNVYKSGLSLAFRRVSVNVLGSLLVWELRAYAKLDTLQPLPQPTFF
jgi:hypothetical protein